MNVLPPTADITDIKQWDAQTLHASDIIIEPLETEIKMESGNKILLANKLLDETEVREELDITSERTKGFQNPSSTQKEEKEIILENGKEEEEIPPLENDDTIKPMKSTTITSPDNKPETVINGSFNEIKLSLSDSLKENYDAEITGITQPLQDISIDELGNISRELASHTVPADVLERPVNCKTLTSIGKYPINSKVSTVQELQLIEPRLQPPTTDDMNVTVKGEEYDVKIKACEPDKLIDTRVQARKHDELAGVTVQAFKPGKFVEKKFQVHKTDRMADLTDQTRNPDKLVDVTVTARKLDERADMKVEPPKTDIQVDVKVQLCKPDKLVDVKVEPTKPDGLADVKVESHKLHKDVADVKVEPHKPERLVNVKVESTKPDNLPDVKVEPTKPDKLVDVKVEHYKPKEIANVKVEPTKPDKLVDVRVEPRKLDKLADEKVQPRKPDQLEDVKVQPRKQTKGADVIPVENKKSKEMSYYAKVRKMVDANQSILKLVTSSEFDVYMANLMCNMKPSSRMASKETMRKYISDFDKAKKYETEPYQIHQEELKQKQAELKVADTRTVIEPKNVGSYLQSLRVIGCLTTISIEMLGLTNIITRSEGMIY